MIHGFQSLQILIVYSFKGCISLNFVHYTIFFHLYHKIDKALKFFDAIGLAAFSVIGFKVALAQDMSPVIAVMMGVWTAIIGGLLRDIICNEIPLLLQREIYITASIAGSLTYLALDYWGVDAVTNEFIMLFIIFFVRMLALKFDWHLPSIRLVD